MKLTIVLIVFALAFVRYGGMLFEEPLKPGTVVHGPNGTDTVH